MALIKPTLAGSELFGQIGGQNISLTKNGSVIRNTTYSNKEGTTSQTKARAIMAGITNKWQFLTPTQKSDWATTATNYQYKDSAGNTKTRNAYQTFCFCNRNLSLITKSNLSSPATFQGLTVPVVTNESTNEKEFIIKTVTANPTAEYLIYAQVHNSVGAISFTPNFLLIATITQAQFLAGYNVINDLRNNTFLPEFRASVTLGIFAVDINCGNRTTDLVTVNHIVDGGGLKLDILSYYPFNGNANDYFGINNPSYDGGIYGTQGIVNNSVQFTSTPSTYLEYPNSDSLNFIQDGARIDFCIACWYKTATTNRQELINKRRIAPNSSDNMYTLTTWLNAIGWLLSDVPGTRYLYKGKPIAGLINTQIFILLNYNKNGTFEVYINNNLGVRITSRFTYVEMATRDVPLTIGRTPWTSSFKSVGYLSELVMFNQTLNADERTALYNANLNGQTIIDIN